MKGQVRHSTTDGLVIIGALTLPLVTAASFGAWMAFWQQPLDGPVSPVKSSHGGTHIALALNGDARTGVATVLSDTTLVRHVDDQNQYFELELAQGATPQRLLERLVSVGAPITRFELVQPSLHQIFLQTVGAEGVEEGMSGQG
jgi:ABC-2 type transport system ATP-binding protein